MAEPTPGATPNAPLPNTPPATPPSPGADPKQPENDGGQKTFNPSELSDEDFGKIFEDKRLWTHDRFKQLNDKAKKADELEAAQKAAADAALAEQGKFKELAEQKQKEAETLRTQYQQEKINNKIILEASKLGVVDSDAVLALLDKSGIKINDATGQVEGADVALKALLDAKPYLKGATNQPTLGQPSNPGQPGNEAPRKFKLSQLSDTKFYRDNEADILKAQKLGLIEDDTV